MFNFLQDIAIKDANRFGIGLDYKKGKYSWILVKYRMEFVDYPMDIDEITLTTQSLGYNKFFTYRNFTIAEQHRLLGRIISLWSIIDRNSRKVVDVDEVFNMPKYVYRSTDLVFSKLKPLTEITLQRTFEVRYNDLDSNGHANNGNYIVWSLEALPFDFKREHKIKNLEIIFKKEARGGDHILSEVKMVDHLTTQHQLKNVKGEILCLVKCEWEKIILRNT